MAARGGLTKNTQESYKEAIDSVSAYNARLCYERKLRAPFLDAQTGIAMNNCYLWMSKVLRRPGPTPQYLYSYPARRWRKKKRAVMPLEESEERIVADKEEMAGNIELGEGEHIDSQELITDGVKVELTTGEEDIPQLEVRIHVEEEAIEDAGAMSTDDDDFEIGLKRKPGRGRKPGSGRKPAMSTSLPATSRIQVRNISRNELARMDPEERKKPYVCEICGKRYKNGPGLKYHYTHYNHDQDTTSSVSVPLEAEHPISLPSTPAQPAIATAVDSPKVSVESPMTSRGPGRPRKDQLSQSVTPNSYCDFCLGDMYENKKTGVPEELLSCADCGRSGHPSCLQFDRNLTESVKKYKWQCIECKSCTFCGTSDNDDQLLFCDDCDRGYHMYCLKPPMDSPPEGHWICDLCKSALLTASAMAPPMPTF